MKLTARQLRTIIREAMDQSSPRWPEKHFAWRNVVFTSDGDVRYIIDVSEPETVQAAIDIGEPFPPGTNVLIVKGAYPNTEKVHLHDSELLDLIRSEGWHERPPPKGADPGGFWDGKGEWQEPDSEIDRSLPVVEGKMKITKRQLRRFIRESLPYRRGQPWTDPKAPVGDPVVRAEDHLDRELTDKEIEAAMGLEKADPAGDRDFWDGYGDAMNSRPERTGASTDYKSGWESGKLDRITELSEGKMRVTKRQLRRIIKEQMATVADSEIEDVVLDILSDEGGAAGLDPIEDELKGLEDDETSLPDEPIEDVVASVTGVKRHADGDFVDTTQLESRRLRVTVSQLRRIVREGIDVINNETGEVMTFEDDWETQGGTGPEAAAHDVLKRLRITPEKEDQSQDPVTAEPVTDIYLAPEDWAVVDTEFEGKRRHRKQKRETKRLDIDNLLARVDQWAEDAGGDYGADNPGTDMQGVARDLALGAEFEFREDEWDALINHFDDLESFHPEDDLITYIADRIAG